MKNLSLKKEPLPPTKTENTGWWGATVKPTHYTFEIPELGYYQFTFRAGSHSLEKDDTPNSEGILILENPKAPPPQLIFEWQNPPLYTGDREGGLPQNLELYPECLSNSFVIPKPADIYILFQHNTGHHGAAVDDICLVQLPCEQQEEGGEDIKPNKNRKTEMDHDEQKPHISSLPEKIYPSGKNYGFHGHHSNPYSYRFPSLPSGVYKLQFRIASHSANASDTPWSFGTISACYTRFELARWKNPPITKDNMLAPQENYPILSSLPFVASKGTVNVRPKFLSGKHACLAKEIELLRLDPHRRKVRLLLLCLREFDPSSPFSKHVMDEFLFRELLKLSWLII